VFPETRFSSVHVALHPGESLLLYTDGVPEARAAAAGRDGRRGYFGLERVGASTAATAGKPAVDLVNGIKTALHVYTGGRLDDDVALLAVQVTS
jgi:phosphoserine phosphatase RsbU/P